jgi:class 3 adenylate cyclase
MNEGDDTKALAYYLKSLQVAEKTGDTLRIVTATNNIAAVYGHKPATHDKALLYALKALPLSEKLGDKNSIGTLSLNIGEIYAERNKDSLALIYFRKALLAFDNSENSPAVYNAIGKVYLKKNNFSVALKNHGQAYTIAKKLNGQRDVIQSLRGLALVYAKMEDQRAALNYFKQAESIGLEIHDPSELLKIYEGMSTAFAKLHKYDEAYAYKEKVSDVKDTIYNIEADKKLASMQFDFDLQKKQGEINLLTKDKTLKDLQLKKQKFARNTLIAGLCVVLMIALLLYRNYRIKVKTNKILDKQNDEIQGLLLNILPSEVAKELQLKGTSTPKNYESVSVMFTDFKGFTTLAETMTPQQLVEELNACFIEFDNIIVKYNLEKIKTIGDSYMCAGGLPTPDHNHAYNIVQAGLEIQEYIIKNNERRIEAALAPWDVRIGIHVGPVVAGVVGKKKYAYDIWGSTVNIASRMESNGAPGQVNISAPLYDIVKDKYACTYRGKIYAKNVGDIDMYFVETQNNLKPHIEEADNLVSSLARLNIKELESSLKD